jgi:hypothetical protein
MRHPAVALSLAGPSLCPAATPGLPNHRASSTARAAGHQRSNRHPQQEIAMQKRTGGCNCGQVNFEVSGPPVRVGLCHCRVCRKETGSIGNFFAVWRSDRVSISGETRSWRLSTDNRHYCPTCGSSVFGIVDGVDEVEIRAGAFDEAPTDLTPSYELWVARRECWLVAVDSAEQHQGNRT